MSDPSEEIEKNDAILADFVSKIGEHFQNVQIFASNTMDDGEGGTMSLSKGAGNFMARYGQCRLWVKCVEHDEMTQRYE